MYDHDCVIMPGFGGFVCNRQPAKIDQVTHLITPPGKHVVFNQNLKNNDGLLANEVAQTQKLSYSDAVKWIEQTTEQIKTWLTDQKQLEVEGFGRFRLNAEANYVFIPQLQNNYTYSSFGLMPVQASPVATRTIKTPRTKIFRERSTVKQPRKVSRQFWPAMLATTLSLLLVVNAWIYFKDHSIDQLHIGDNQLGVNTWFDSLLNQDSTPHQIADETPVAIVPETAPSKTESIPAEELSEEIEPVTDPLSVASSIAVLRKIWMFPPVIEEVAEVVSAPEVIIPEIKTKPAPSPVSSPAANSSGKKYFIITGVFWKEPNAEKYATQLIEQGYKAEVLESDCNNCKRVSIGSFNSKQEAETFLRQIQSSVNADAWIYTAN